MTWNTTHERCRRIWWKNFDWLLSTLYAFLSSKLICLASFWEPHHMCAAGLCWRNDIFLKNCLKFTHILLALLCTQLSTAENVTDGGTITFCFQFQGAQISKDTSVLNSVHYSTFSSHQLRSGCQVLLHQFIFLFEWLHPQAPNHPGPLLALGPPLPPVPLHYSKLKIVLSLLIVTYCTAGSC